MGSPLLSGPTPDSATNRRPPALTAEPVVLAAALNEMVSFEFGIRAGRSAVVSPRLELAPFVATSARTERFPHEIFRIESVEPGPLPGWHIRSIHPRERDPRPLDVLIPIAAPRGGLPAALQPGGELRLWVDLSIPKGTDQGVYTSRLSLFSEGSKLAALDIELTVRPFVLPDAPRIPAIAELDGRAIVRAYARHVRDSTIDPDFYCDHPRRAEIDGLLHRTMAMLQAHGLAPVLPDSSPRISVRPTGEIAVDWATYDELVAPLMSGEAFASRVPLPAWPLPVPDPLRPRFPSDLSVATEVSLRKFLTQCARHFKERGWFERSYMTLPFAPNDGPPAFEATVVYGELVRAAAGGEIPIAAMMIPQDMRSYGWTTYPYTDLSDSIKVWMPPAQFYDPDIMAREQDRGRRAWLAVDRPPFSGTLSIHGTAGHVQILGWQAVALGADAIHVGAVNAWPEPAGVDSPTDCVAHSPDVLLYPGGPFGLPEPVASVRLKHLRRSLQDLAYVQLLNDHGLGHISETLARTLVAYAGADAYRAHFADGRPIGWVDDPAQLDLARRIMAKELINAAYSAAPAGTIETFARSADWLRLMGEARRTRLQMDGVRIRPVGFGGDPQCELLAVATVDNGRRLPLSGNILLSGPNDLFAAPESGEPFELRPGESRSLTLRARGNLRRIAASARPPLTVSLSSDDETVSTTAKLPLVTAAPVTHPLRIDGHLSDWPARADNVLSDFELISPAAGVGRDQQSRRPAAGTSAFVLRDDRSLYIGINCETTAGSAPRSTRKSVRYDDMVPVGEELVEVLIDPSNLGSRSPADLYHIVVKRSGADLIEKGIGFDPPWSERASWAADIDIATRDEGERWTAEIRIPLAAFVPGPHRGEVWGLNITRFEPTGQEFSTWSGAVGNAYDPLSLGNVYLP